MKPVSSWQTESGCETTLGFKQNKYHQYIRLRGERSWTSHTVDATFSAVLKNPPLADGNVI